MTRKILLIIILHYFSNIQAQHDTARLAYLYNYINKNYFAKSVQLEAYANEAIAIAKQVNNQQKLADLLRMRGVIQYFNGKHDNALQNYFEALKYYENLKDITGKINTFNEIGTLYRKNNRLNEAAEILNKALTLSIENKDSNNIAKGYNNIGIVLETQKKYKEAREYYNKSANLYTQLNDSIGLSYSYENIGGLYLLEGKYKSAENYLLNSYNLRKALNLKQSMAFSLHYLGEFYQQKGDVQKAISMYNECALLSQAIHYPDITQRAYFSLSNLYAGNKDYKNSLAYYQLAVSLKDSIFNAERNLQITTLQTQFDVQTKEKENQLLKSRLEIDKQQTRIRQLILILIISLLLFLLLGVWRYFIRKRQLAAAQTQLKVAEAEHQQRLQISHDLHDNVGAQLSFIVSNLEITKEEITTQNTNAKRINSIVDMSRNAILTLRETVWALNNKTISIEAFIDKFRQFAHKMTEFSPNIKLQINSKIEHPDYLLKPNDALHLYRICQESLSNALKHSNATKIEIEFSYNNSHPFNFKIMDNGIGFDMEMAIEKGHYGLQNMKDRASEIGANYKIETIKNKGTIIEISLNENRIK